MLNHLRKTTRSTSLARFQSLLPGCVTRGVSSVKEPAASDEQVASPSFDKYKKPWTPDGDYSRRAFGYMMVGTAGFGYATMLKVGAIDALHTMSMSKDVVALANIKFDLNSVAAGSTVVTKFRGQPLFIRHRTEDEIQAAIRDDETELRDQQKDSERVLNPKYLVVMGICTHLGCVPLAGEGNWKGFLCPCHFSHYDTSGRIRKGPAPLNLAVPDYCFIDDTTLYVGSKTPPED